MTKKLYDSLEDALTDLESGRKLDTILADNPELKTEFSDILDSPQMTRAEVGKDIPAEVLARSRTFILSRAMQLRQNSQPGSRFFRRSQRLTIALILAFVILLSGGGLAAGSAQALPGDQLYPVKRVAENLRLNIAVTLKDHQAVEDRYQTRRINEVEQLLSMRRSAFVQFHGRVNKRDGERWDIGGIDVRQNSQTILIGNILPGVVVEVEGLTIPEGWVQAAEIHLQTLGFVGYVESISPEVWQIGGRAVQITPKTKIDPGIQIGDWVVVSAFSDDFGNLSAHLIDNSNLPTPTIEPPTPTATLTTQLDTTEEPEDAHKTEGTDHDLDRDRTDDPKGEIEGGDSSTEENEVEHEDQSNSEDDHTRDSNDEDEKEEEGKDEDEKDEEENEKDEEDHEKD
jgi:hypothetical protein